MSQRETMVERVAQAMFKVEWGDASTWEIEVSHHEYWRTAARAAIEAMRGPTDAMTNAGDAVLREVYGEARNGESDEPWQAMISAALAPPPAPKGETDNG